MKSTYRVLAMLIAAGVVVQAMAIALGWFTALKDLDDGAVIDKNYDGNFGHVLHGQVGMLVMPVLALLLLIVSFFAGIAGGVKWAAIVLGLVALQITLAFVSFGAPALGALHGLNAFAVLGVAAFAGRRAAAQMKVPMATDTALGAPAGTEATS
jgi:hypothetical protein